MASDGSFKLGDLGHSVMTDGSMPLLEEGDQRYLSQEVLAGVLLDSLKSRPDQLARYLKAADIFALGATMYVESLRFKSFNKQVNFGQQPRVHRDGSASGRSHPLLVLSNTYRYELASRTRLQPSGPEWHRLRSGHVAKVRHPSPLPS